MHACLKIKPTLLSDARIGAGQRASDPGRLLVVSDIHIYIYILTFIYTLCVTRRRREPCTRPNAPSPRRRRLRVGMPLAYLVHMRPSVCGLSHVCISARMYVCMYT